MNNALLHPINEFETETYSEFEHRYTGFGKEIYITIKQKFPLIFAKLTFYKQVTYQTKDSYAQYVDDTFSFAIQLDPDSEVIVLWNDKKHIEIGTWADNVYEKAIRFIESECIQ